MIQLAPTAKARKGHKRYEVHKTKEGKWCVLEVNPKKWRHSFHFFKEMPDAESAVRLALKFNAGILSRLGEQADRRAKRNATRLAALSNGHPFKVGQLFSYSWGYDQTNVEFFEIVAVKERSVKLRPIASHGVPATGGFMCQRVGPSPGQFTGEAFTKVVKASTGGPKGPEFYMSMAFGTLHLINPEDTQYESWYA